MQQPKKHSDFKPVKYAQLNARQKELFNFQKIAAILADYGFNCIKLADDWKGADFIASHLDGTTTLRVQLKSRLAIQKKYLSKDLWIAFPHKGYWYLIKHDQLVRKVKKTTDWLETPSWRKPGGGYSSGSINSALLESLAKNRLGRVYGIIPEEKSVNISPWNDAVQTD